MKIKIILVVLCCLLLCGCSNIKSIRNQQLSEDEVVKYVTDLLNAQYEGLDIKLDKVDKAYTVEGNAIRNGKSYYFKITDKDGNKAYASYKDAFRIDNELYESSFIESYGAIYNNKELEYYKFLAEKYFEKDNIIDTYYASDYKEIDYVNKVKVVYKLNYKLNKMTWEQYANLLKLGYDIKKYRLENYGALNYDDPEIYLLFKGNNKYYYVSHYGLKENGTTQYDKDIELNNDYTDTYNLKNYLTFSVNEEELNKVNNQLNTYGKYLLDNVHSINVKSDDKNGYILINNYTKNNYLMNLLIKFKYDSDSNSFIYQNINMIESGNIGDFDGSIIKSW